MEDLGFLYTPVEGAFCCLWGVHTELYYCCPCNQRFQWIDEEEIELIWLSQEQQWGMMDHIDSRNEPSLLKAMWAFGVYVINHASLLLIQQIDVFNLQSTKIFHCMPLAMSAFDLLAGMDQVCQQLLMLHLLLDLWISWLRIRSTSRPVSTSTCKFSCPIALQQCLCLSQSDCSRQNGVIWILLSTCMSEHKLSDGRMLNTWGWRVLFAGALPLQPWL